MGSLDENDVLGYAGIPVNVNGRLPDFLFSIGAAGGVFLPPGRYYVSVDSGRDLFSGRPLAGRYTLRSWVNDVRPPTVRIVTKQFSSGRPTIVARITDAKSGVDPLALQLFFGPIDAPDLRQRRCSTIRRAVLPSSRCPREACPLEPGPQFMQIVASDYQEAKNINTESRQPLAQHAASRGSGPRRFRGQRSPGSRPRRAGARRRVRRLLVVANDNAQISSVGFFDGKRQIGRARKNVGGSLRR